MTTEQTNAGTGAVNRRPKQDCVEPQGRLTCRVDHPLFAVYIIVVTYNAEKWLPVFGRHFQNLPNDWKVIVVDNASTDHTVAALRKLYPHFNIVENGENIGFGRANNIGLKMAFNAGVEHVFLLNQDACIEVEALEKLLVLQKNNPEYFIVSPMHYSLDQKNLNGVFAAYCNPYACPNLLGDAFHKNVRDLYQAEFVNAAAWLISRECLEKIGGFNPAFFLYSEDDEYARRVNYHGGKIGLAPGAHAAHHDPVVTRRPMGHKFFRKLAQYFDPANDKPSLLKVAVAFIDSLLRALSQPGHPLKLIRHAGYLYSNKLVSRNNRENLKTAAPHFLNSSEKDIT